jgi:hypothetical protein
MQPARTIVTRESAALLSLELRLRLIERGQVA